MSIARPRTLTLAWAALVAITVASVYTAEFAPWRIVAVALIMAIAAAKGLIILWQFMDAGAAPASIRWYMMGWVAACAAMIFGGYWIAAA